MTTIFGGVNVEQYKYDTIEKKEKIEIRKYHQAVQVCVKMNNNEEERKNGSKAFPQLAKYIGVFQTPENKGKVLTDDSEGAPTKIAMTAPVVIAEAQGPPTKIAMTAPVVIAEDSAESYHYMSFILPSQYQKIDECPEPTNPNVWLEELPPKFCGVLPFKGRAHPQEKERSEELLRGLDDAGIKHDGKWRVAQFNPPWCIPMLRYNEIIVDLVDYVEPPQPQE